MKRSVFLRALVLIFASLLMLSCVSCTGGEAPATSPETGSGTSAPSSSEESKEPPYLPDTFPGLEGFEFKVLTRDGDTGYWAVMDLTAEEYSDEPINDAVFERNASLEQKYGFTIDRITTTAAYADTVLEIQNINKSGIETYHAVAINAYYTAGPLAANGDLVDLTAVSTMQLDKDHWNQRFIDNMTIGERLYAVTGDLTVTYYDVAWIQLFNKDLCEDKNVYEEIGDPYEFVNNGTWTLDVMNRMGALASEDLNGDGARVATVDRFGYAYAPFNNYALYYAGGNSVVGKDDNDMPILTVYTTKAVDTIGKIQEMIKNKIDTTNNRGAVNEAIFNEGRSLFVNAQMMGVRTSHRHCEFDFGILPTPKIDASQENYTNVVSMSATVYSIPTSCAHLEETGFILDALSYASKDTLVPAYFDTTFGIVSRDPESEEALNNILKGAYFDLSFMFDIGGWMTTFQIDMETMDLASKYDSVKDLSQTNIDELVEKFS